MSLTILWESKFGNSNYLMIILWLVGYLPSESTKDILIKFSWVNSFTQNKSVAYCKWNVQWKMTSRFLGWSFKFWIASNSYQSQPPTSRYSTSMYKRVWNYNTSFLVNMFVEVNNKRLLINFSNIWIRVG